MDLLQRCRSAESRLDSYPEGTPNGDEGCGEAVFVLGVGCCGLVFVAASALPNRAILHLTGPTDCLQ